MPQSLAALEHALHGPGAPDGVIGVLRDDDRIVVTWDPSRSSVRLVMATIDAELARYRASRRTELLTPLSDEHLARIAASELQAPQIEPDRVLERLLEQAGLC
ncbi:MAG: hypothetical protein ACREMP_03640 [Candidatus Tyrphobacter sp.]